MTLNPQPGSNYSNEMLPGPHGNFINFSPAYRRFVAIIVDWVVPFFFLFTGSDFIADLAWCGMLANSIVLQGRSGASVGKRLVGIAVAYVPQDVRDPSWDLLIPGVGRCAFRYVAHVLDFVLLIGVVRTFFNPFSRSFADSLAHTIVVHEDRSRLLTRDQWLMKRRGL